ncbi:MAG: hypothetical protein ACKVRN_06150 [Pyrinomonadaceae bacterium]
MRSRTLSIAFLLSLTFVFTAVSAFAQGSSFSDPNADYSFNLPDAKWKMTVKPSATNPNVEYVYGDRTDGHLTVRKQTVAKTALLSDVISDDETKRQFLPGYIAGRQENFSGKSNGSVFNFEYVASGRSMSGRYYFLRTNDTTVYILRFAGQKDSLRSLRSQTDSIARSFAVK